MKCVECSAISGKGEGKIFGDNTINGIRIDCNYPSTPAPFGDGQCESACGSDASCDEKSVGDSCGTGAICSNSCTCVTTCDSTSCPTSGDLNCGFNAGETKSNMCGNNQYYWYTAGARELVTWTMTPTSNYDLYANWGIGDAPTISDYDCRPYSSGSTQEACTSCLSNSGTRHTLVHKDSGTGKYDISLSKTSVECCSDANCATNPNGKYCDTANNKCVECLIDTNCESYTPPKTCESYGFPNRIAKCHTTLKTCSVCGQCFANSDCKSNYCCDADTNMPASDWGTGQCVNNVYRQKYLCTN